MLLHARTHVCTHAYLHPHLCVHKHMHMQTAEGTHESSLQSTVGVEEWHDSVVQPVGVDVQQQHSSVAAGQQATTTIAMDVSVTGASSEPGDNSAAASGAEQEEAAVSQGLRSLCLSSQRLEQERQRQAGIAESNTACTFKESGV